MCIPEDRYLQTLKKFMQKVDQLSFLKNMVNDKIIKESKLNTLKCNIREAGDGIRNNHMMDIQNKIGLDDTVE